MFVCLSGGVGGAKLASGLSKSLKSDLTVVVNTGDDFEHLGLYISPDLDTVTYNLAGMNNRAMGWGIEGETWHFMDAMQHLGGPRWFKLGDRDLATHVMRTTYLRQGMSLSEVTSSIAASVGIQSRIVPMSDDPVRTMIVTSEGILAFQEYFVGRQCTPIVQSIHFDGLATARPSSEFLSALRNSALRAIVIGPSNPFLSVAPILSLDGIDATIDQGGVPVIAVSPIVAGKAIKGPAAKIMRELGVEVSPVSVAKYYRRWVNGFVLDERDADAAGSIREMGLKVLVTDTIMTDPQAEIRLGEQVREFASAMTR